MLSSNLLLFVRFVKPNSSFILVLESSLRHHPRSKARPALARRAWTLSQKKPLNLYKEPQGAVAPMMLC